MSHELRTPLNSLLILSDQLSKNPDGNLTGKQVEFAQTIHASGNDLLTLINDILDLSKIESGTVVVDIERATRSTELRDYVERTFRHVAEAKRLDFSIDVDRGCRETLQTDPKRLQQVLKNLLSNAFKFTERGSVQPARRAARASGWSAEPRRAQPGAGRCWPSRCRDTGIGIPPEKQQIIFEAFQQADGSTSRKYGGTGLGLAISRELARLLGGELALAEQPRPAAARSRLYLPQNYTRRRAAQAECPTPIESRRRRRRPRRRTASRRCRAAAVTASRRPRHASGRAIACCWSSTTIWRSPASCSTWRTSTATRSLTTAFGAAAHRLARERQPDAITLDISLPDIDGWRVLDRLKHDLARGTSPSS